MANGILSSPETILDGDRYGRIDDELMSARPKSVPSNLLRHVTVHLTTLIFTIDPFCRYEFSNNPKRILTKPSKGVHNNGVDNTAYDYILTVGDLFGNEEGRRFVILDLLGHGTFGQVVKCQNIVTKELVAIKIIKNQAAYFNQSMMEVTILEMLNSPKFSEQDRAHITRMKDTFVYKKHLCIVFELLSLNIFELLKQNHFKGFSHQLIRIFLQQILSALCLLNEAKIVHCDLKPENILLKSMDSAFIKVIDFGSACHEQHTVYTYIQSRFYRSPEVILGLPYSSSIDIWSLGCIAAELFLGIPIFPGTSNYDQISRIIECIGMPPTYMLEVGKNSALYFEKLSSGVYKIKDRDKYNMDIETYCPHQSFPVDDKPSKRYFSAVKLYDIIMSYPMKSTAALSQSEIEQELESRKSLHDLISNLLNINPIERWSPQQARLHPYILGEPWKGPFTPPGPACLASPAANYHHHNQHHHHQQNLLNQHHYRPRSSTINSQMYNIPSNLEKITNVLAHDSNSSLRSIPGSTMYEICSNSCKKQNYSNRRPPVNDKSVHSQHELEGAHGTNKALQNESANANSHQQTIYTAQVLGNNNRLLDAISPPAAYSNISSSLPYTVHRRLSNPTGFIGTNPKRSAATGVVGAGVHRYNGSNNHLQHLQRNKF